MLKPEKTQLIAKLASELKDAQTIVMVDFAGLNIANQQELKKRLKEVGARMLVAKNTLIRLAGKEAKIEEQTLTDSVLSGQTALILSSGDPVSPIQIIGK